MSKKKKRRREQVERADPTLPWESPHPSRGHRRNSARGKAMAEKYPTLSEVSDLIDYRLPGSFESGKRR
jgi:hypothetical protein